MISQKATTLYQPACQQKPSTVPLAHSPAAAGFPSPADDHVEGELNLHDLLIPHPTATFFVRVEGDSMQDAGIHSGDLLIVDRSLEPKHGKIVLAIYRGEFTVKRLEITPKGIQLVPSNAAFPTLSIEDPEAFQVWGIVTYVIHKP